jgi:F-type H+-transporting ATPase subunit a
MVGSLGLIFVLMFRMAAKKATSGQPGALQNFVEVRSNSSMAA